MAHNVLSKTSRLIGGIEEQTRRSLSLGSNRFKTEEVIKPKPKPKLQTLLSSQFAHNLARSLFGTLKHPTPLPK